MTPERLAQLRLLAEFATYVVHPGRGMPMPQDADAGDDIQELCDAIDDLRAAQLAAVQRLRAERARLVKVFKAVLDGFDAGVFVRNVGEDDDSRWALRVLPYLTALANAQAVVVTLEAALGVETQDGRPVGAKNP